MATMMRAMVPLPPSQPGLLTEASGGATLYPGPQRTMPPPPWIPQIHASIALLCLLSLLFDSSGTTDDDDGSGGLQTNPMSELKHFFVLVQKRSCPAAGLPGQGGSSVGRGNFLEIGPLYITMKRRPCTWLHVADLIFVDSPVGVGFSYADHPSALVKTDKQAVSDLLGVIQELIRKLQRLQSSPVYVVGESYGGKMAAMLGLVLERAIRDGTMNLTLGGVVIGDGWISPADYALSYGDLLHAVSRLNDNAVSRVNKMGLMVEQQMAAGQFAAAQKTWTDQLDLIDSQSDSVNMYNFLLDTGMNPVLSSSLLMYLNNSQQASQSALSNNTGDIINRVFKPFLRIIPKTVIWEEATLQVYEELKDVVMRPAMREVDELLALGVSVTVYNGQYDVIVPAIGSEAWVKKLKWDGLNHFLSLPRHPLHYCDSTPEHCSKQIRAYVRAYENLVFYWILGAGHMVPVDQPYPALRMIANITQSPGNIDDTTCN